MGAVMKTLNFTVDSELLRELGERLVSRPYIALAELVKNSYDADAIEVTIRIDPKENSIVVADNGHGMTEEEFKAYWMRIGSSHKRRQENSRYLKRPLTGSKGVGRLAAQFLADRLEIFSIAKERTNEILHAKVDWTKAIKAGELTKAEVNYEVKANDGSGFDKQGFKLVLSNLKQDWDEDLVKNFARELWWLQPPFQTPRTKFAFRINFDSPVKSFKEDFDEHLTAILDIWEARVVGRFKDGTLKLSVEFRGEEPISHSQTFDGFNLKKVDYEIRIYNLQHRQPYGLKVGKAREYFMDYGGIHVYDSDFILPFYDIAENDWLGIELDHSHRVTTSDLLPGDLKEKMKKHPSKIPTLSRVFGVVKVQSSREDNLKVAITRDKFIENETYKNLQKVVRTGFDYYVYELVQKEKKVLKRSTEIEPASQKLEKVDAILDQYKDRIEREVYTNLQDGIQTAIKAAETEEESVRQSIGLLGSLATAGMSSLAYRHQLDQHFALIERIIKKIDELTVKDSSVRQELQSLRTDLSSWLEAARNINKLFEYLKDPKTLEERKRFKAKKLIDSLLKQIEPFSRQVEIKTERIKEDLILPTASLPEWAAIFQNILFNAFNALLESEAQIIELSSHERGKTRWILVQDTGCGLDLETSEDLFEPFVRRIEIPEERKRLAYGGSGLGLTIVRFIASKMGCNVSFVEPEEGFSTAFKLSWREK